MNNSGARKIPSRQKTEKKEKVDISKDEETPTIRYQSHNKRVLKSSRSHNKSHGNNTSTNNTTIATSNNLKNNNENHLKGSISANGFSSPLSATSKSTKAKKLPQLHGFITQINKGSDPMLNIKNKSGAGGFDEQNENDNEDDENKTKKV